MNNVPIFFLLFLLGVLLSGCGTTTGNALVRSSSYNTTGFISNAVTNVSTFKFCVKTIQLQDDNDTYKKKDDDTEIAFSPGLIDVSSGTQKDWGQPNIPVDFTLKRILIHIRRDPIACPGVNYSLRFNDFSTNQNIVLKWRFNPPVAISNGDTYTLSLSQIVSALRTAADLGTLNNNSLKDIAEAIEESAEHSKGN